MVEFRIITRKEAVEKKLKRYFTGKPCKKGHIANRIVGNHKCVECLLTPEQKKQIRREAKKEYDQNPKNKKRIKISAARRFKERSQNSETRPDFLRKRKKYNAENKAQIDKKKNEYYKKNKEEINKKRNIRNRKRYKEEVQFKIMLNLRTRLGQLVKTDKMSKSKKSLTKFCKEVIGTSLDDLINHLENQWYYHPETGELMTWENNTRKGWHIDHIKPIASFDLTKLDEQKKCFHYTNLQPLWAEENLSKSDKYL